MNWRQVLAGLGWAVAGLLAAGPAGAFDFRDRQITIKAVMAYEDANLLDGSAPYRSTDTTEIVLDAVAGKMVWLGSTTGCVEGGLSLVYTPGASFSGTAACKPFRKGTPSCWSQWSANASYTTNMVVAGNVLTLTGRMTGTATYALKSPTLQASDTSQLTVIQVLKIRIVGETCQVLELRSEEREDTVGTINGGRERGTHTVKSWRRTLAPGASCTMARRSDTPDEPNDLGFADLACSDR